MAITFSNDSAWDDNSPVGRGVAIENDRYGFEGKLRLTLAEALQVRDELNRRYPLTVSGMEIRTEQHADKSFSIMDKNYDAYVALSPDNAIQVRDALIKAYPLEPKQAPDDLAAANKLNAACNAMWVATSRQEMLGIIGAKVGDICARSDLSDYATNDRWFYVLSSLPASEESNWLRIFNPEKLREHYPLSTYGIGATVSKDDAGPFLSKRDFDKLNSVGPQVPAHKLGEAHEEIASLRAKVKRIKRALKGALK